MTTDITQIANNESGLSIQTKMNRVIDRLQGNEAIKAFNQQGKTLTSSGAGSLTVPLDGGIYFLTVTENITSITTTGTGSAVVFIQQAAVPYSIAVPAAWHWPYGIAETFDTALALYSMVLYTDPNSLTVHADVTERFIMNKPLLAYYPGAAAAYSLRDLTGTNPDVVKVRRSSDNAEEDFTAVDINDGSLVSWVGAGNNGLVTTWYDQSGNGNDATQATAASQPKIVDNGALVLENGKAAVDFDGVDDFLGAGNFSSYSNTAAYGFFAFKPLKFDEISRMVDHNSFLVQTFSTVPGYNGAFIFKFTSYVGAGVSDNLASVQQIMSGGYNGSQISTYINSNSRKNVNITQTIDNTSDSFEISSSESLYAFRGNIQELILYPSDQSANRIGIENLINSYYNIYQP